MEGAVRTVMSMGGFWGGLSRPPSCASSSRKGHHDGATSRGAIPGLRLRGAPSISVCPSWERTRCGGREPLGTQGGDQGAPEAECFTISGASTAGNASPGRRPGRSTPPGSCAVSDDSSSDVLVRTQHTALRREVWPPLPGHVLGHQPVPMSRRSPRCRWGSCCSSHAQPHAGAAQLPGGPALAGPPGAPLLPHPHLHQKRRQPHRLQPRVPEEPGRLLAPVLVSVGGATGARGLPHRHQLQCGPRDPPRTQEDRSQGWGPQAAGSPPAAGALSQRGLRAAPLLPSALPRPASAPHLLTCWVHLSTGPGQAQMPL